MPALDILEYPDPRLRVKCVPVTDFGDATQRLVDDLLDTLYATSGIGLSAPQVGHAVRVVVLDLSEHRDSPEVFINPTLLDGARPGFVEESCLSVPGLLRSVVRHTRLNVEARDRQGTPFIAELEGMHAVALQHEADHLDGLLFLDRLPWFTRLQTRFGYERRMRARRREEVAAA